MDKHLPASRRGAEWIRSILQVARYAAEKHSEQRRKGAAAEPYFNHLIEVADLVAQAVDPVDPDLVAAALLHDVVEDAAVTVAELQERFGAEVARLVAEVTDDKSLPKEERKRLQIEHAPMKSPGAQAIKLADKISNLQAILDSPPAGWSYQRKVEYFAWAGQVVAGLTAPPAKLRLQFERLQSRFAELMRLSDLHPATDGPARHEL